MKTPQFTLIPLLGLYTTSTLADFVIGRYAGSELGGTFSTPGQLHIIGTWNSAGIEGQKNGFGTDDFCSAGTSAGTGKLNDWKNNEFCDLEIPGCPFSMRIVRYASRFSGDCGAATNDADRDYSVDYGVLIDTVSSRMRRLVIVITEARS
ncbi:uncharacterized protein J4E88_010271 [Alternaria novae-zelandiae]|uniref:uncharacterized protein n=1 Tax=Alternaria novae-zelandiae TaxID=430562 RepID=UPI0020C48B66|nr:uncharacterized protein J4E88_010271 [Alternaria novae-zelandiae]KAI4667607.1 hypothetical protein J4E88_010271 [Alternaria novae-zelandiae]